jgi:hypothetical protein
MTPVQAGIAADERLVLDDDGSAHGLMTPSIAMAPRAPGRDCAHDPTERANR